jgi:hypothetical protein
MSEIVRAIAAERLKLKRTFALRLAIGAPITIVRLNFIMVSQRSGRGHTGRCPARLRSAHPDDLDDRRPSALHGACRRPVGGAGTSGRELEASARTAGRAPIDLHREMGSGCRTAARELTRATSRGGVAAEILKSLKPALRGAPVPLALVTIRSLQVFGAAGDR